MRQGRSGQMLTASAPLEHLPSEDMALDVGVDYGFKMLVLPNINLIFRDLFLCRYADCDSQGPKYITQGILEVQSPEAVRDQDSLRPLRSFDYYL